ncbi:MAG: hypothetical protein JW810_07725 [Sedimentisphaerales bacterium]|nr:hypothetical protein [Sedimentisphaerales bacterium]
MKYLVFLPVVSCLLLCGGCMPNEPLEPGQLNQIWTLSHNPRPQSTFHRLTVGEIELPAHWTIHQDPSVIRSTVSFVRAYDRIREGTAEVEFSVSPANVDAVNDILRQVRLTLADLSELAESGAEQNQQVWSRKMAGILTQIEYIIRATSIRQDDPRPGRADAPEPMGYAAEPLLHMLAVYLNEQVDGSLLGDLQARDIQQLRQVLTQIALHWGYALAGRQFSPEMLDSVTEAMRVAERLDALENALEDFLLGQLEKSPPSPSEGKLQKTIRILSDAVPRALLVLESFLNQWDCMEKVEFEFRRWHNRPVLAVTLSVRPQKEIRLASVIMFQPSLVFTGTSRITVLAEQPGTEQTIVYFESLEGSGVELRFDNFLYDLVRLFAFPLEDGSLREMRLYTSSRKEGASLVHLGIVLTSPSDTKDPRRMIVFQEAREKTLARTAFDIQSSTVRKKQIFHYINAERRYTFTQTKDYD